MKITSVMYNPLFLGLLWAWVLAQQGPVYAKQLRGELFKSPDLSKPISRGLGMKGEGKTGGKDDRSSSDDRDSSGGRTSIPTGFDECSPDESMLIFPGHDEVYSLNMGTVNITWSPAFVYNIYKETLVWCEDYTYDVYIAWGSFNFTGMSPSELSALETDPDNHVEHYVTMERELVVDGYLPGDSYSILVTARTASGIYSFNRYAATVTMATTDPVYKEDFTRWVNLPHGDGIYEIETVERNGEHFAIFTGSIPDEVLSLEAQDYMYFFRSDGTPELGRCIGMVPANQPGAVVWQFLPSEPEDVFDELDLSVELSDVPKGAELDDLDDIEDEDPLMEERIDTLLDDLPLPVRKHLCKIAYPDREEFDCYLNDPGEDEIETGTDSRQLIRCCRRLRRAAKKVISAPTKVVKKAVKVVAPIVEKAIEVADTIGGPIAQAVDIVENVVETAIDVVEVVGEVVEVVGELITTGEAEASATITFLDINKGARMSCFEEALQLGVNFDASARFQVSVTLSLKSAIRRASAKVFGGLGVQAYLFAQASGERTFTADPKELFSKTKEKVIMIGPVPCLITTKPAINTFMEATVNLEAEAFWPFGMGWDYEVGAEFDQAKSKKVSTFANFDKRPPPEEDPVFNLRLAAAAEVGLTLSIDIFVMKLLRAGAAVDLGFSSAIEVGTNLDAIAVTRPFFYTLDQLDLNFLIRGRANIGFGIEELVSEIEEQTGLELEDEEEEKERCTIEVDQFEFPSFDFEEEEVPEFFDLALSIFGDGSGLSLDSLLSNPLLFPDLDLSFLNDISLDALLSGDSDGSSGLFNIPVEGFLNAISLIPEMEFVGLISLEDLLEISSLVPSLSSLPELSLEDLRALVPDIEIPDFGNGVTLVDLLQNPNINLDLSFLTDISLASLLSSSDSSSSTASAILRQLSNLSIGELVNVKDLIPDLGFLSDLSLVDLRDAIPSIPDLAFLNDLSLTDLRDVVAGIPSISIPDLDLSKIDLDGLLSVSNVQDAFTGALGELEDIQFEAEFEIFNEEFKLLGLPTITMEAQPPLMCQGNDALVLTITTTVEGDGLALTGIRNGEWFANFDGNVFREDTPWILDANRSNPYEITMRLPRQATNGVFEIPAKAAVFLRATPELLPIVPKSMFVKEELAVLFEEMVVPFDCCDDSDCAAKFPQSETTCNADGLCEEL